MLILYELGSSLVTGGSMRTEQDSWIATLIGLGMTIPLLLLYAKLQTLCPNGDIYDMSRTAFGKVAGSAVTLLFSLYALHLGAMVIRNFTEYIQVLSLPETPQPVCAVCIGALAFFTVQKGLEVSARSAEFVMPIGYAVIGILVALVTKNMEFSNLQPFLNHDARSLFSDGFSALTFPFAESVVFLSVFCTVEKPAASFRKIYLMGTLVAGAVLTVLLVGDIAVLGMPIARMLFFPTYETVGVVDIGNFISRIEVLVSGNFIVFGLVKISTCMYVGCRGIMRVMNWKNIKLLAGVVTIAMIVASQLLYKSTMEMFTFLDIYKRYAPFFEIALPLALLAGLMLHRGKKPDGAPAEAPGAQTAGENAQDAPDGT